MASIGNAGRNLEMNVAGAVWIFSTHPTNNPDSGISQRYRGADECVQASWCVRFGSFLERKSPRWM